MEQSALPLWKRVEFGPKGSLEDRANAINILLASVARRAPKAEGKKEQEEENDPILPIIPDGRRLSRKGVTDAIDDLVMAYRAEVEHAENLPEPESVSKGLKNLAQQARGLADVLSNLSPAIQWRLASLASPSEWPRYPTLSRKNWAYSEASNDGPDEPYWGERWPFSERFVEHHAGELVPAVFGNVQGKSGWEQRLEGLAALLEAASAQSPGPLERRDERDPQVGYSGFLLVRECDAILCAAGVGEPLEVPEDGFTSGNNSHPYHRGLTRFSEAVLRYATNLDPAFYLKKIMPQYSDSFHKPRPPARPTFEHPWGWRVFRVASLRLADLEKYGNRGSDDYDKKVEELAQIGSKYRSLISVAMGQGLRTKEQWKVVFDKADRELEIFRQDLNNLPPEIDSSKREFFSRRLSKKTRIRNRAAVLAGIKRPGKGDYIDSIENLTVGYQTLPPGYTFLSGVGPYPVDAKDPAWSRRGEWDGVI